MIKENKERRVLGFCSPATVYLYFGGYLARKEEKGGREEQRGGSEEDYKHTMAEKDGAEGH